MRIGADDLAAALRRPLGPLYTVVANEPLLGHEALAALRARAREEGYGERTVLTSESGFRWEALRAAGDSLSLFASRRLVEVRVPTGKPGREGGQALADYAKRLPPDTVTLVSLPALDWSGMKAAWLKALEAAGVLVMADPFPRDRLVGWIETRLAKNGQRAAPDTLAFLADRVEGNLSAANQEVEKLALSFDPGELSFEQVSGSVLDVSRFDLRALIAVVAATTVALERKARALELERRVATHREHAALTALQLEVRRQLEGKLGRHRRRSLASPRGVEVAAETRAGPRRPEPREPRGCADGGG